MPVSPSRRVVVRPAAGRNSWFSTITTQPLELELPRIQMGQTVPSMGHNSTLDGGENAECVSSVWLNLDGCVSPDAVPAPSVQGSAGLMPGGRPGRRPPIPTASASTTSLCCKHVYKGSDLPAICRNLGNAPTTPVLTPALCPFRQLTIGWEKHQSPDRLMRKEWKRQ